MEHSEVHREPLRQIGDSRVELTRCRVAVQGQMDGPAGKLLVGQQMVPPLPYEDSCPEWQG